MDQDIFYDALEQQNLPAKFISKDDQRRLAWIGDTYLSLDVKVNLLAQGVDTSSLTIAANGICNAKFQAAWLHASGIPVVVHGHSDHSWSTAFESIYLDVRRTFLEGVFGPDALFVSHKLACLIQHEIESVEPEIRSLLKGT